MTEDGGVGLRLTRDEALVLFEAATKVTDQGAALAALDGAEAQSLHDLVALLERELPQVLDADYDALLAAAKARSTS